MQSKFDVKKIYQSISWA